MLRISYLISLLVLLAGTNTVYGQADDWRIRPLANDYVTLYRSPEPNSVYLYDPSIAVCPNGRLIGACAMGGSGRKTVANPMGPGPGFVFTSDDDGQTWTFRTDFEMYHFSIFQAGDRLYILGHYGDLRIMVSHDWGDSWSEMAELTEGQTWHGSATNIWHKNDHIYLVRERKMPGGMKGGWRISECAPVLLRGDVNKDLTQKENWTFASEITFAETINDRELDWFGVPFHDGYYPHIKRNIGGRFSFPPIGWLEANVVQIVDPKHYWYDSTGRTFHIFMRAHTGITNLACMVKAVEQEDGSIKTMLQKSPSGKTRLYLPWPGGHMKFCVVYDDETRLYWLLNSQSTDSMTRPELLLEDRYGLGDNERHRLVLHFSKNMVDWCFAGLVCVGPSVKGARHYANMVIDDDDLLIMSRSGDRHAKDAHNGNIITFHRVRDFRRLAY